MQVNWNCMVLNYNINIKNTKQLNLKHNDNSKLISLKLLILTDYYQCNVY